MLRHLLYWVLHLSQQEALEPQPLLHLFNSVPQSSRQPAETAAMIATATVKNFIFLKIFGFLTQDLEMISLYGVEGKTGFKFSWWRNVSKWNIAFWKQRDYVTPKFSSYNVTKFQHRNCDKSWKSMSREHLY